MSYDWNHVARRILADNLVVSKGSLKVKYDTNKPPTDSTSVKMLVDDNDLHHGDIIAFDEYRDAESYILLRDIDGIFSLAQNTDDTGSGYITIPKDIFRNVTKGIEKYNDVINSVECLNLHISCQDVYLKERLGEGIPEDWQFDVHFILGTIELFAARTSYSDWVTFDLEKTSLDDMKMFFEGSLLEQSSLVVTVHVEGDQLVEYQDQFSQADDKYYWMKAFPSQPPTWKTTIGSTSKGGSHFKRDWTCKGPAKDAQQVRADVMEFFKGFNITIK